jgi:chemotaxis protein methyltransferase CheR
MTSGRRSTYDPAVMAMPVPAALSLSPEQFARLRDILAAYSGVYLDTARQRVLENGLAHRLKATGDDLAGYEWRIRAPGGREELRRLAELVLNHETVFFRNAPHVHALRDALLPELHRRKPHGAPIRIWSAGCATGEEAYSLAIIALETLGRPLARPVEVWATDLSEPALHKAREGVYRGRALQNVAPELLRRYFQPKGDGFAVAEAVRTLVRFETLNLLEPFPQAAQGIDIIFCQNVTIYFQLETCRKLIARFYECLPEGGLLFLGFSETLWNVFDRFHTREVSGAYVYYKRPADPAGSAAGAEVRQKETPAVAPPPRARHRSPSREMPRIAGSQSVTSARLQAFHDHARREQGDVEALTHGRALLEQGEIDQAFETLRHISPQSSHAPQALTLIARAHADRGDLDLAAAEVQRALEIDTLNDEAYLLLGIIYGRQGQWPEAIRQLERARYLSADSALISFHLAEAYRQGGHAGKAAREYRNTLRKLDKHPPGAVLDGVAAGWLRETCERQIEYLPRPL